jgi:5-methyltetrahydrofolate--homocysteine methyltransferase
MGTQLQAAGLEPGGCGELWNSQAPDKILAIQRAYVEAGSDCLITNTFGGSRIMLERHGLGDRTVELNQAAVRVARRAFGDRPGFVLGGIGPFGGLMEPLGEITRDAVREAFDEQAASLVDAGADAIIIETQTSLDELGLGIEAAKKAGAPCIIGSMAFDLTFDGSKVRTMMGTSPRQGAEFMENAGADILAQNCGTGVDMVWAAQVLREYSEASSLPLMAQPNAGTPVLKDMKIRYMETPDEMAGGVPGLLQAGARIIGGCCGSTPDHIRALRKALDERGER